MQTYVFTMLGTLAALAVYNWASIAVGQARGKTGVKAPATTGNDAFERVFRAHQNTMEQLVVFLPLVWIVAALFGDVWGGAYAAVWVIGRVLYIVGYAKAAENRSTGFTIAAIATLAALVAAIVGTLLQLA